MKIQSTLTTRNGEVLPIVYTDAFSEEALSDKSVTVVHAFAFYNDELVVVYSEGKKYWTPPGGGVESEETAREALIREIKEETNMRVLESELIGYQDIQAGGAVKTHARFVSIVEPLGPFVEDPDGDVTQIKCINPKDYKKYFDWGEIGDHLLERAVERKEVLELKLSQAGAQKGNIEKLNSLGDL